LVSLLWQQLQQAEQFPIQSIRIEGDFHHLKRYKVEQAILPHVMEHGFFSLHLGSLKEELIAIPWVDQVSLQRVWPDTLVVKIIEQKPIAKWGTRDLVNAKGTVFSPRANLDKFNLPVLNGPQGQQAFVFETYQDINELLSPFGLRARQLTLSSMHAWDLQLNNGTWIKLGHQEPLKPLSQFLHVYKKLFAGHAEKAAKVDLRYPTGMAVRWES
jgi:cell division protein FtsQ